MMKRDLDLIRDILLLTETATKNLFFYEIVDSLHVEPETLYKHLLLMQEMRLIHICGGISALTPHSKKHESVFVRSLTPSGYDYLKAIRNDTSWEKCKSALKAAGKAAGVATVNQTVRQAISHLLS